MRYAELSIKQPYHRISKDAIAYRFAFCVKLPFDEGLTWFVGRRPQSPPPPMFNVISLYNPAITSTLCKIRTVSTNYGSIHLLESLHNEQFLYLKSKRLTSHVLEHGHSLAIPNLPLEISYKIIEEPKVTDDEDTVSSLPIFNERTEVI